jgi:tetratricopeptide (TPR) repeat protein
VATLAERLRDERRRLDELKTGDLAVRASFHVSYDMLPTPSGAVDPARAFRLLGLWQGTRISLPAAAALLGEPEDVAASALEVLVDVNLLESPAPDQYRLHDLLKVYALERAESEESEGARQEALGRLLRWYLHAARAAADAVSPQSPQVPGEPEDGACPPLAFASTEAALGWYDDERPNLVAATRAAADAGLHEVASRLPPALFPMFNRRSNWADCITTHRIAIASAEKTGNRLVEAFALCMIGFALVKLPDPEAFPLLERALAIREELGDAQGEAVAAIALAEGHLNMHGAGEDAIGYLRRAVDLLEPMEASPVRKAALNNLGDIYFELDDLDAAADSYLRALESTALGGYLDGFVLFNLGRVYMRRGSVREAIARFEEALPMLRAFGAMDGEALVLQGLGVAQAETGDTARARVSLTEALRIFELLEDDEQVTRTAALLASVS